MIGCVAYIGMRLQGRENSQPLRLGYHFTLEERHGNPYALVVELLVRGVVCVAYIEIANTGNGNIFGVFF